MKSIKYKWAQDVEGWTYLQDPQLEGGKGGNADLCYFRLDRRIVNVIVQDGKLTTNELRGVKSQLGAEKQAIARLRFHLRATLTESARAHRRMEQKTKAILKRLPK